MLAPAARSICSIQHGYFEEEVTAQSGIAAAARRQTSLYTAQRGEERFDRHAGRAIEVMAASRQNSVYAFRVLQRAPSEL